MHDNCFRSKKDFVFVRNCKSNHKKIRIFFLQTIESNFFSQIWLKKFFDVFCFVLQTQKKTKQKTNSKNFCSEKKHNLIWFKDWCERHLWSWADTNIEWMSVCVCCSHLVCWVNECECSNGLFTLINNTTQQHTEHS